jgi:hypothetical protein
VGFLNATSSKLDQAEQLDSWPPELCSDLNLPLIRKEREWVGHPAATNQGPFSF